MRKSLLWVLCLLLACSGCSDLLYLEETDISQVIGLDQDENGHFVFYSIIPVFDQDVKKKYDIQVVHDKKLFFEARKQGNAQATGFLNSRKLQVLLLSKELLSKKNVFPYLDVLYRDPKNEIHSKVAVVDGRVGEMINTNWEEKGQPGVVLKYLLDQGYMNGNTMQSTLFRFGRQMLDQRVTPYLSEIKMQQGKIEVVGTTLLNQEGKYQLTLDRKESSYLQLLKQEIKSPLSIPVYLPEIDQSARKIDTEVIHVTKDVQTKLKNTQLVINVNLQLTIDMIERQFYYPNDQQEMKQKMEQMIAEHFKQESEQLIAKLQQNQVDPIALGVNVCAQQYPYWKKIEHDWSKVFSKAKIEVNPQVTIRGFGITM